MADLSITATQVQPDNAGTVEVKNAAAAITAGQTLCLVSSTTVGLADADGTGTTSVYGIALANAATGQPVSVQRSGTIVIGAAASIVEGTVYFLSDTAGGIKPAADLASGDTITYLGVGDDDDGIVLSIHNSGQALA